MSADLGYDLEEALQLRASKISAKGIKSLRASLSNSEQVPKSITDKLVWRKLESNSFFFLHKIHFFCLLTSQLALFLDASDGQVDVAKKTVETYYDTKANAPEHFVLRDPQCSEIQQCLANQWAFGLFWSLSWFLIYFLSLTIGIISYCHLRMDAALFIIQYPIRSHRTTISTMQSKHSLCRSVRIDYLISWLLTVVET